MYAVWKHMLLDLDKLQKPSAINKLRLWGFITVWILKHIHANGKEMQMHGSIKLSAQNRLPEGNYRAHHKHFHWTVLVYQFKNHGVQYLNHGHMLCQGISIWFSCWSRATEVQRIHSDKWYFNLKWRSEIAFLNCPLRLQHQLLINGCQGRPALPLFKAINCRIIFIFTLSRSSL